MKKVLLTSTGFDTQKLQTTFLNLFDKEPSEIKALFIPTAANAPKSDGIMVLPKCMNDLLVVGIPAANIEIFDMHRNMTEEEISQFDVLYFTGGSTQYLYERMVDTGFIQTVKDFVLSGGVYVGVSAGSIVGAKNVQNGLGFIDCTLDVHQPESSPMGVINFEDTSHINLANGSAIVITGEKVEVVS